MPQILATEYVQIGTWVFATPACSLADISGVFTVPELRGDDRVIPGQPGVAVRRRLPGPVVFTLPIAIVGDVDPDGEPIEDPRAGLLANIAAMREAILPPSTAPYTRQITHQRAAGARTAACVVTAIDGPDPIGIIGARLSVVVKIPSGTWAAS